MVQPPRGVGFVSLLEATLTVGFVYFILISPPFYFTLQQIN